MNAIRFRIVTADGQQYIGPVQGCGGLVGGRHALRRMWSQVERATEGEPLGIYEPATGCCCLFPEYSAAGNGPRLFVKLAGATVSQLSSRECAKLAAAANQFASFSTY